ncbi:carboxy-S-adenosyl-L-methionine synthase CmoA [Idiomarina tyrosinivorans]|uniref:Carboxy-S-adenosyl-L-methionine synthase n=1 Tax=Idiomarina tyrosinivorans TaxID=1445662 RepID=A0A432ZPF9_9GAMM|nr:carboxy-S-adenosyl-L-methionine synthase CmoA [Idiomarina tyrosinivorans]RUO79780.1 carboxy-S-adenosyl-L-methionine synthase CmoA [Idiomarina tyrosinivorans]
MSSRDNIFSQPLASVQDFCFDQQVVEVFPDMINRSVPGYASILQTIPQLTQRFVQDNTKLYDLGCSRGAATLAMRQGCEQQSGCEIIAIDNSPAMVERAKQHIDSFKTTVPITVRCEDIVESEVDNASVVVMNFTLQFVAPELRQQVLEKVFNGLRPGGVLILSEKIRSESAAMNELLIDLHHDFKRANGYSDLEISQKRAAIENVMRIDSLETHQQRLTNVGFSQQSVWFQCFNFLSMVAVK